MAIRVLLRRIEEAGGGSYASIRALAELDYLSRLARTSAGGAREGAAAAAEEAAARLAEAAEARGGLSLDEVSLMEARLDPYSSACKALRLICVGHAHIDMNWMWGFHETVSIAIDTMRTVLGLMERYPDFRFSQSQASVYRIVERYAPALVGPIAARIAEGRWESLAAQWVEADMVLPSGESLLRQMLYARRYMKEAFGAPESSFETVFLPDTFGYPASTPEMLGSAGVKNLYHCRGAEDRIAYRWAAPTGRGILAYRDPRWYNTDVGSGIARFLPAFARDTGLDVAPCVYGVGDHGGGPTMRDIERLADMAAWPIFPTISFGGLSGYFAEIAARADLLPTFTGEPERLFTGCYSSQSRIKAANARAQEALYEAELLELAAAMEGGEARTASLGGAWIDTLFGQFHDILPGSGVRETREMALGLFQGTMASAMSLATASLRAIAGGGALQAAPLAKGAAAWQAPRAEGGGAGFGAELCRLASAARDGGGGERRFLLFNQLQWDREERVELVLWDWREASRAAFYDEAGARLPSQLLEASKEPYWGHDFAKFLVEVRLPGFGFASVFARDSGDEAELEDYHPYGKGDWLVERERSYVLENEFLRVSFDASCMGIASLVDKRSGTELVDLREPTGLFRLVEEDAPVMTAWIVGRRRRVENLGSATKGVSAKTGGELLVQWIEYKTELPALPGALPSSVAVRISLDKGSARLRFDADCDWRELGAAGQCLRQLDFALALRGRDLRAMRDIPFGVAAAGPSERDAPATSFMAAAPREGCVVQLTAPGKQAFRLEGGRLSVTLLRGSIDPDPYPETGRHRFSLALCVHPEGAGPAELAREALGIRHRLISVSGGAGSVPPSLLRVEGEGVVVSSLKLPEEGGAGLRAVLRLYEAGGAPARARVSGRRIRAWRVLDSHERAAEAGCSPAEGGRFELPIGPGGIATLEILFDADGSSAHEGE